MRKAFIAVGLTAILCLMLSGVALGGRPGPTGTVSGTVKDISTGAAVAGATISNGTVSATTDANGNYTMNVATGSNTLSASAGSYITTYQVCTVTSGITTTVNWSLTKAYGNQAIPAAGMDYTILAWNDLGMHCDQDDYSYFMVLPPYNTLHVQIQDRNGRNNPIMSGVTVSYAFPKKTNSALHTNWWTYQSQYGFNQPVNVGISGTPLAGDMVPDANNLSWVAEGIPITPYDDDGTWDPYGTATITVKDSAGNILQTADVVAPVSTEMTCSNCHGTSNPQLDILQKHDEHNGTTLATDQAAGKVHACAECHADNALGAPGKPGVENLSLAMHQFHAGKAADTTDGCYNCHPGPKTQCLRGIMERAGKGCVDCHGSMAQVASSIVNGRNPWLEEPRCADCHDAKHAENDNTLYRNSVLQNGPNNTMNGKLYCEACHNSTHAELTTAISADASITQKFQGDNYWIWNCTVCHTNKRQQPMHK
ncbi:MAG TPA: carboxypeptidase regulatory-like domain-containing protein [Anaerolineae bacterium]|nr:carboxypeptidase regulatory-like domain-containing protein [Anaerolineae bacterium]